MNKLISLISRRGYADRILNGQQLARILGGSDDRRFGLVKRALKSGELIKVKRGQYLVADIYRTHPVHPYALAQALDMGSYVSMETALAFHGWIPEAVYSTVSVTSGRKSKAIEHPQFGRFEFNPLALNRLGFLNGVDRHILSDQPALVASPLRALMDIVAYRKQEWVGLSWIESGLRIERKHLFELSKKDFDTLKGVYKHNAAKVFLDNLENELSDRQSARSSGQEG